MSEDRALLPDEEHAVALAWATGPWMSTPGALVGAYAAAGAAETWEAAAAAAEAAGACPEDASLLADAWEVSASPNAVREVWVQAASDLCGQVGGAAREAVLWVTDADMTVDARLGARIAARAARLSLSSAGRGRHWMTSRFLSEMHAACRPEPSLAAVVCPAGFEHAGRWYGWSPAFPAAPDRWSAVNAAGGAGPCPGAAAEPVPDSAPPNPASEHAEALTT